MEITIQDLVNMGQGKEIDRAKRACGLIGKPVFLPSAHQPSQTGPFWHGDGRWWDGGHERMLRDGCETRLPPHHFGPFSLPAVPCILSILLRRTLLTTVHRPGVCHSGDGSTTVLQVVTTADWSQVSMGHGLHGCRHATPSHQTLVANGSRARRSISFNPLRNEDEDPPRPAHTWPGDVDQSPDGFE